VPKDRILARYPRNLAYLAKAVRLVDAAILYDSHDVALGTHKAVAACRGDLTQALIHPLPVWAQQVLHGV